MVASEKKMDEDCREGGSFYSKVLPPPLLPGGCIAVVAPAGTPDPVALEAGLEELRRRGYRLKGVDQVTRRDAYGFAGSHAFRAETLMAFFEDPSVDALWVARGGYGCTRLFPYLDARRIATFPKRLVGFSDTTALLAFLWQLCGMVAFHGPVLTQLGRLPREDRDTVFDILAWEGNTPLEMRYGDVLRPGKARGRLCGGNLTLLSHLLGTPWCPDFSGTLLFLEDVNEASYRIDRMLCHLSMVGVLHRISGLLLGTFTGCGDPEEIYARILTHLPPDLPVVCGLPLGHGVRNQALIWGAEGVLDTDTGRLVWEWKDECP